jgi:hypothetical protein
VIQPVYEMVALVTMIATEMTGRLDTRWITVVDSYDCGKSKTSKKDVALSWKATKLRATPTNVPLLLSAVSTVPEKSLAWKCGGVFGSKPESLAWMESHLPDPDQIPVTTTTTTTTDTTSTAGAQKANNTVDTDTDQVEALWEELEFINRELDKERDSSKSYAHKIAQLRTQNDEWVAMMGLVRQEMESVLHRYHILLESDMAMQASERLYHEHEEERIADETAQQEEEEEAAEPLVQPVPQEQDGGDGEQVPLQVPANAEDTVVPTVVAAVDEANDGDNKDSNDDDDEELQGDRQARRGRSRRQHVAG